MENNGFDQIARKKVRPKIINTTKKKWNWCYWKISKTVINEAAEAKGDLARCKIPIKITSMDHKQNQIPEPVKTIEGIYILPEKPQEIYDKFQIIPKIPLYTSLNNSL